MDGILLRSLVHLEHLAVLIIMLSEFIVCAHYDLTVDIGKHIVQTTLFYWPKYVCLLSNVQKARGKSGNNDKLF